MSATVRSKAHVIIEKRKQHDSRNYGVCPRTDGMTGFIDTIDDRRRDDRGERTEQSEDKYYVGGRYQHALTEVVLAARRSSGIGVTLAADYRIRQRLSGCVIARVACNGTVGIATNAALRPVGVQRYCTGGRATLPCFRRRSWLRSFLRRKIVLYRKPSSCPYSLCRGSCRCRYPRALLNGALDA